ncbi:ABC transporter ATP-binding protein [Orientia tsutsugamushi]|uniref:ABC transporter ATP-binding protein n=1 Tax=Orientia tsutsugamushi TaxID=784 RepID=UPI0035281F7E
MFNSKSWERKEKFSPILQNYINADQKRDWSFIKMYSFQNISFIIYQILCFIWLVQGLKNQSITAGDFILVLTLNTNIINCLSNLSDDIGTCADIIGNVTQGLRVTDTTFTNEVRDDSRAKELIVKKGKISFNKVCFAYNGNKPFFENITIEIKPGEKIGLVGRSGSGKSTFVNLILRFYDITSGSIKIDGQDIRNLTLDSLRRNFSLIPQDPSLFHRTIMKNIHYGDMSADKDKVIESSKLAHIHNYISNLPNGYNSFVGERGVKLSGGERQRIAIARAILKNAPMLILDEATSHLDSITEEYIQESIHNLMQNKTTIIIAHRLSTLLLMDRIIVFNNGEIIEVGTHQELLNKNGLYKILLDSQVGGFLRDN